MANLKSAAKRIQNFLQITDEGVIESQLKKVVNYYNDMIQDAKDKKEDTEKIYKRNMRNAEEELVQLMEEEVFAFNNFDIARCKKKDESKAYVFDLDKQFTAAIKKIRDHKAAIEQNKLDYENKIKELDATIADAEYKLDKVLSEAENKK